MSAAKLTLARLENLLMAACDALRGNMDIWHCMFKRTHRGEDWWAKKLANLLVQSHNQRQIRSQPWKPFTLM